MKRQKIKRLRGTRKNDNRLLLLLCAGLLFLCLKCGKKGPPRAPEITVPPAVSDLEAEVMGDRVRLTWSIPKEDNTVFEGLTHFGVFKYESDSSAEMCPGCPIPFIHYLDIKLDYPEPAWVEDDRVVFHDIVEADHRYVYKVVAYHEDGGISEDSNIVRFLVKPNE